MCFRARASYSTSDANSNSPASSSSDMCRPPALAVDDDGWIMLCLHNPRETRPPPSITRAIQERKMKKERTGQYLVPRPSSAVPRREAKGRRTRSKIVRERKETRNSDQVTFKNRNNHLPASPQRQERGRTVADLPLNMIRPQQNKSRTWSRGKKQFAPFPTVVRPLPPSLFPRHATRLDETCSSRRSKGKGKKEKKKKWEIGRREPNQ